MSLRLKMGLEDDVFTNTSRIIILKIEQKGVLGIIVDEVKRSCNTWFRRDRQGCTQSKGC